MNTITILPTESTTLYFREGNSDKVYQACIEPNGDLFVVNFAYGRRGTTLQTGTKTSSPVKYEAAKGIYDKLLRDKMAKGYSPGENGAPYEHTNKAERDTGIRPQLLNAIEEEDVNQFINEPAWCMQEKFDGRRTLLLKEGAAAHGINRRGLLVGLPSPLIYQAGKIPGDCILDGECVGEVFYAFDLLRLEGDGLEARPYKERLALLAELLGGNYLANFELVKTAYSVTQKKALLKELKEGGKEGVVFKRMDAAYTPGRPSSGGSQLKHKFYATVSAVVSKINQQRSVEIRLLNGKGWIQAGNVTIPANHQVPNIGAVVEIRYLYAMPGSNCLYQPVYLGLRKDIEQHECVVSQLKFKAEEDEG